jgi:hypothetical protein
MEFYRYEDVQYECGPRIHLRTFYLIRETPCGHWISGSRNYNERNILYEWAHGRKRWVSKTSRKRFAYPTKAEAMTNFKARKRRQIDILEYRANRAKLALSAACEGSEELKKWAPWLEGMQHVV